MRSSFSLPGGDAAFTLRQLSRQASESVVFPIDRVRGVRTNPVQGEFTTREAAERMVAGTDLFLSQDPQTGALLIARRDPPESGPAQSPPSSQTSRSPMKSKTPLSTLRVWLGLALAPLQALHAADASPAGTITGRVSNLATGKYLNNARVSLKGTDQIVFTDAFGTYQLINVPSGSVVLEVFYTDLDPQEIALTVKAAETLERNIDLTSRSRYGATEVVLKLDAFVVASTQETDSQAIALNEQRFSPNIKNVMAADSFGDVLGSSVGEFLKFLPGVALEEDGNEVQGVSIRGGGGSKTAYTTDGSPLVTANNGASRNVDLVMLALDSISRLEVTKVPTPSTPADSLSGSVNMVSKSAFERKRAQFDYGLNLIGNGEHLTLRKTPQSLGDRRDLKTRPGFNFTYTVPIRKTFGLVLSGVNSDKYSDTAIATKVHSTTGTGTGASISRPFLQNFTLNHSPKNLTRTSFTLKADWRVTPHSVLSLSAQTNRSESNQGSNTWVFDAGTNGTPAVVGGVPMSFNETGTTGAAGRGSVTLTSATSLTRRSIDGVNLTYRYDDGRWKVDAGCNASESTRSREPGVFSAMSAGLFAAPNLRVSMLEVDDVRPGKFQIFDNTNREIDPYDINNYRLNTATELISDNNRSTIRAGNVNLRRRLSLFPFPAALQSGAFRQELVADSRVLTKPLTYAGPDGNTATADSVVPYATQVFRNQDDHFGYRGAPWYSPDRAMSAYRANPGLFTQTPAQVVSGLSSVITSSEKIRETISALYLQGEARFFQNRLNLLTGVRFEGTQDEGEGPVYDPAAVWVRNASGSFVRNAAGQRIRRPEAGATGSMEELLLTRQERGYRASRSYHGYFPSLHLTYGLKENVLLRAAYARTYARPNFGDIVPNTTINEADLTEEEIRANPNLVRGNITVRNISLKPWTADNFDLSAEYYTPNGGMVSAGLFLKEIKDFFGNGVKLATLADLEELGLDPQFVNWNISTKFNAGDARISGAEFEVRQSLRFLGRWGNAFHVFANGTYLKLEGDRDADFTSFVPKSANWGVSFSRQRLQLSARWNYRSVNRRGAVPAFGPDAYNYFPASTRLDLSAAYQASRRITVVSSVNNVSYVPERTYRYGSATPNYARYTSYKHYGIAVGLGVKGSF
jgi:TonB-dependent receptor